MIKDLIKEKNISILDFSKLTGIPYSTLHELVSGKKDIRNCSMEMGYKISKVLDISMEQLYFESEKEKFDYQKFDMFKSNVCHMVKNLGELGFIEKSLKEDFTDYYWNLKQYPQAYYMLAMTDFLSERNGVPLYINYHDHRLHKLNEMVFPYSAILEIAMNPQKKEEIQNRYIEHAEPVFLKYGIVEGDVFNVC